MNTFILLAFFSGIAVMACVFLTAYFLFIRKLEDRINSVLGFLFFAIALRIGKSIFYFLLPDISAIGVAAGFLGLSMIGPLMLGYFRILGGKSKTFKWYDALHLLLPVTGFFAIWLGQTGLYSFYLYQIGTGILLLYLLICWKYLMSNAGNNWNTWLLVSITLIWGALVYQHLTNKMLNYAFSAGFAALVIYFLIFSVLKNPVLFRKISGRNLNPDLIKRVIHQLEKVRAYQQASLTLVQFSTQLGEPSYLVSKSVQRHYGRSFPEVVNSLRVAEVKDRLKVVGEEFVKIEGLAFDAGFNTPSAFYAAFKKETSLSPREYQKRLSM